MVIQISKSAKWIATQISFICCVGFPSCLVAVTDSAENWNFEQVLASLKDLERPPDLTISDLEFEGIPELAHQYYLQALNGSEPGKLLEMEYQDALLLLKVNQPDEFLKRSSELLAFQPNFTLRRRILAGRLHALMATGARTVFLQEFWKLWKISIRWSMPDSLILFAANLEEERKNYRQSHDLMERLAARFPITKESIVAFEKLEAFSNLNQSHPQHYSYSLQFLTNLGRLGLTEHGVKQFVMSKLDMPIRKIASERPRLLDQNDKLAFKLRLGWFVEAETFAESNLKGSALNLRSEKEMLVGLTKAQLYQGDTVAASKTFEKLKAVPRASSDAEVRELGASIAASTQSFDAAAQSYKILAGTSPRARLRWQHFWFEYLAGRLEPALQLLERKGYVHPLDDNPSTVSYWRAKLMERSGELDSSMNQHRSLFSAKPKQDQSMFYAAMTAAVNPSLHGHAEVPQQEVSFDQIESTGEAHRLWPVIVLISESLNLDPLLLASVMRTESGFSREATSYVGAIGLMQIMPHTGARLAVLLGDDNFSLEYLRDPYVNIAYGAFYLKKLLGRYQGNIPLAVAAYNAGPTAVDRWLKLSNSVEIDEFVEMIPYQETRRYVKKVVASLSQYWLQMRHSYPFDTLPKLPTGLSPAQDLF